MPFSQSKPHRTLTPRFEVPRATQFCGNAELPICVTRGGTQFGGRHASLVDVGVGSWGVCWVKRPRESRSSVYACALCSSCVSRSYAQTAESYSHPPTPSFPPSLVPPTHPPLPYSPVYVSSSQGCVSSCPVPGLPTLNGVVPFPLALPHCIHMMPCSLDPSHIYRLPLQAKY